MKEVELSYKMLRDSSGYKSIEEVGSILESMCTEDTEEVVIKDLPFAVEEGTKYYLENVSILDRGKQEYILDSNTEKVFGLYLVTYNEDKDLFGMIYVSENGVYTVFDTEYADVDIKSMKFFCAFDDDGNCVAQVYDDGDKFIDVTDTYAHEIFKMGVYEFTSVNMVESVDLDALYLYVSILGTDEDNNEVEIDSFLLRNKSEVREFFNQVREDIGVGEDLVSVLNESEEILLGLLRY